MKFRIVFLHLKKLIRQNKDIERLKWYYFPISNIQFQYNYSHVGSTHETP